jgi:hypothetical protein
MSANRLGVVLAIALLCALLCAWIAARKGRNSTGYFILGLCTGPIGLIITIALGKRHDFARFAVLNPYRPARAHPGWYQDPQQPHMLRWHDGVNWTQQAVDTRPAPTTHGRRHRSPD